MIKFGTDGWRGVIGDIYTFDNVRLVIQAVARTFDSSKKVRPKIFIGYDHRFFAEKFAEEVAKVLRQNCFNPCLLPGAVTSPFLSFLTWSKKSPFGIMVTASHNPSEYLGIKVKGSFGGSVSQETVEQIEKNITILHSNKNDNLLPSVGGKLSENHNKIEQDFYQLYFAYLKKHINFSLFQKAKSLVIFDVLYGPSKKLVEDFFQGVQSQIRLQFLHPNRDPLFGGLHPEPIEENLAELKTAVKNSRSVAGFALDGDGDRLGVIDENGNYLTPPQVFSLLLFYLANKKGLKGKVVQAVSLGAVSEKIAREFNLPFEEVSVGFKYVAEKILNEDVLMGGEESGGYAFGRTKSATKRLSLLPERDGLFSALLFLEMIFATGKGVSQLLKEMEKRYGSSFFLRKDIHLSSPIEDKTHFVQKVQKEFPTKWSGLKIKEMRTLDGLKIIMEDDSWILIRPSGTEPLLRTYVEFPSRSLAQDSITKLSHLAHRWLK